ncbi:hypothetical protein E3N88_20285 [Mikania micrantha]|uniref:Reverse transcriptase zinc-binding domain-containing protein n=1 Tax=Mikania micrantha TaxID=192012 RepID=A0A5N6NGM8_9ASTR|nr:hypothetical protein E3N88_20285 [Mikania micrantha]
MCQLCLGEVEDIDHIFIRCPFAQEIWRRLSWWLNEELIRFSSVEELLKALKGWKGMLKKVTTCIYTSLWCIWSTRNNWIFDKRRCSVDNIVEEIKTQAFPWISNRSRNMTFNWQKWNVSPMKGILKL